MYRILVVDDEENIRLVFTRLLQQEGYEVATAQDGFDALLQLKHFLPDVFISDLNMPECRDLNFCRWCAVASPRSQLLPAAEPMQAALYRRECLPTRFTRREKIILKRSSVA